MGDPLSLQIASGILIAAAIMFVFRLGLGCWQRGDYPMAIGCHLFTAVFGGILIFAGLGVVPW